MSKNLHFDSLIDELTYYKNLTEITADCIIKHGAIADRAERIRLCGTLIEVGSVADEHGNKIDKVASANFCRERLCPMCQRRKSLKTYADIKRLVEYLPARGWIHVVLTVRNCKASELSDTITSLYRNSSRLITKEASFKRAFKGALRCLEVTHNSIDDTFHPHLHILLSATKSYCTNKRLYISKKQLRELWRDSANLDYLPQVHIDNKADEGAIAEIAKYCVKPLALDLPPEKRAEVLEVLHGALYGRRLLQSYGEIKSAFRDLRIDIESDSDHEIITDTEQMFVYNFELSQYDKYS